MLVDKKMGYKILADSNVDWGQNEYYLKHYLTKNPEIMYAPRWSSIRLNPGYKLPTNKVFYPIKPQAGLIVIEANNLLGITDFHSIKTYQLIRENLQPVDHVKQSYLVFEIKTQDLKKLKTPAKHYSIETILDFQADSNNSLDYQWGGWSFSDKEGTWTDGSKAHLFMKLKKPVQQDLILVMEAIPFLHEHHPQQVVDVIVNEELVTQLIFKIGQPLKNRYQIPLSAKLINSQSPLQITFRFSNPVSPHSIGLGEDKRLLGLMLKKIKLVEDGTL